MKPTGVLITGTTKGLGKALLQHYANLGERVIAVNRSQSPDLKSQFPLVRFEYLDVRDSKEVEMFLARLVEESQLPETFILNAGINCIDNDEAFQLDAYRAVLDTNLYGVINFVPAITRLPRDSWPKHVVAISSLASYVGNPYGLGYHTSKRALSACFDTWAHMYGETDLVFQQVMLGPVRTQMYTMAEQMPGWMVNVKDRFAADVGSAVYAISEFAKTRNKRLFYPKKALALYAGMILGQRLIPGFFRGRRTLRGARRRESDG